MNAKVRVMQKLNNIDQIRKAVNKLTDRMVFIGVPSETCGRKNGVINNAELSYIHEFGGADLPARPHLRPGVERIIPEAVKDLRDAAKQAFEGNEGAVDAAFNSIGLAGQNSVREMFANNDWPPLSEKTLNYRPLLKKNGQVVVNKKGEKERKPSRLDEGKINPLIVTGSLRNSHIYVIRKRNA